MVHGNVVNDVGENGAMWFKVIQITFAYTCLHATGT